MGISARELICHSGIAQILSALSEERCFKEQLAVKSGLSMAWVDRRLLDLEYMGLVESVYEERKKFYSLTRRGELVARHLKNIVGGIDALQALLDKK